MDTDLPFLDEHHVHVSVPPRAAWEGLTTWIASSPLGVSNLLADLLGTDPRRASGTLPAVDATTTGFRVIESVPGDHLTLSGRHRFARYTLRFTIRSESGGSVLSACSYATFPGVIGSTYRWFVIGTGAHRLLVPRILARIARHAERRSTA